MKIASGSDRFNKRTNYRKVSVNKKKTFPVSTLKEKQELIKKKEYVTNQKWNDLNLLSGRLRFPFLTPLKPRNPLTQIKIRLASPEQIKNWCSRILPDGSSIGEIKNAQTIDYKTLDPKEEGLFCEKIFGPVENFRCICDKKRVIKREKRERIRAKRGKKVCYICNSCGVEHASARVRRYNLGYIQLNSPVTHIWFLKGRISYISILLGYKRKNLEKLTFCHKFLDFTQNKTKNSFLFLPTLFKEKPTYTQNLVLDNSSFLNFLTYTSRIRFSRFDLKMEEKSLLHKNAQYCLLSSNIYETFGSFYFNLFKVVLFSKKFRRKRKET